MKSWLPNFYIFILISLHAFNFLSAESVYTIPSHIRVLLFQECLKEKNEVIFSFSHQAPLTMSDLSDEYQPHVIMQNESACITVNKKGIRVNGKKICPSFLLIHSDKPVGWENEYYEGDLLLVHDKKKECVMLVNVVPLESYVEHVVAHESYGVWPPESHKVSAIVCRTFAVHRHLQGHKKWYDVRADITDQVYKGIKTHRNIQEAVKDTCGQILMHQKKPIVAMYHICCGGVIPTHCSGVDFQKFPYLARTYACNHCSHYKSYVWTVSFKPCETIERLSTHSGKKVVSIKHVKVLRYAKSGTVKQVQFSVLVQNGKKKKNEVLTFNNKELRKIFSITMQSKSACFKLIHSVEEGISLHGRGTGHHFGLCQRGAHKQIQEGRSHREILSFYFPKTSLEHCEFHFVPIQRGINLEE